MPQPSVPTVAGVASPLLGALEHAWAAIRTRHPDVPDAVLVIVSGGDAKRLRLGHFAADRWQVAGAGRHEVLVGGEGLQRGPVDVLATLLHEAAHGLARARGVKDTSRQGRYHCEDQAGEVRSPQVSDEGGSKGKERTLVRYPGAARRALRGCHRGCPDREDVPGGALRLV